MIEEKGGTKGTTMTRRIDPPRVDLLDKVTGRAAYIEDLPNLPGMAYAAALRSPYSHATILSVDSSRARKLPGVLGIIDRENLDTLGLQIDSDTFDLPLVVSDKARFHGDILGVVAAVDLRTARQALELIDVEYEILPSIFSVEESLAPDAPLIHPDLGTNIALEDSLEWGDVEQGFRESDRIFDECFASPNVYHHPMEPATSSVANFANGKLEIWVPTNNPLRVQDASVQLMGLKPEEVRVRVPFVGGSFGAKDMGTDTLLIAVLSRMIGRPVKLIASAEESFRASARDASVYKARVGLKDDGTLVALDVTLDVDTGAYFTGTAIITNNAVTSASGGYRLPHFRSRARTAYTNKVPAGPFRNTGKNQTTFAVDCMMDDIARKLGMDPVEFRLKNLLHRGEYIAPERWKKSGQEGPALTPPVDTDLPVLIEKAMSAIGWEPSSPASPPPAKNHSRLARGHGLSVSMRRGSQVGTAEAMAVLERDGSVSILHNAPDVGEGCYTMISVVASRSLGIAQGQVRVNEPDTANKLKFSGTSSQRTTVQMGGAVQTACKELLGKMAETAARAKGGKAEEWKPVDGKLSRDGISLTFAAVARELEPGVVLQGTGSYKRTRAGHTSFGGHDHWAPGIGAAEVEVDRETGEVRLLQYCAVADAGKLIHYHSAKGQIEGGAVMSVGMGLYEELIYQEGQLQNADPFQYRLPLMSDIPERFSSIFIENEDGPGPFGSKALAQVSIPCAAPAIANAICDAVGVRLRSMPLSPEKILRGLGKLDHD
jgi:CO/xanthine dehydrogenase Mo-binding subunit